MNRFAPRTRADRLLAALLLGAMLWAQALGLAHRVAHSHAAAGPAAIAGGASFQPAGSGPFGHDESQSAQCRLFDQVALGEPLAASPMAVGAAPAGAIALPDVVRAWRAGPVAAYRARGPPAVA